MFRFLKSRWFWGALGVIALAAVIYFLGPLFAFGDWRPLESEAARYIFILLLAIAWLVRRVLKLISDRKAEQSIVEGVVEAAPAAEPQPDVSAEELATIKGRFEEAIDVLKQSRGGSRGRFNLYDLPWYIIIGPPGSGKTTALLNSGLRFPLADRFGPDAIRGVGGTRDCDWWFTDDAVMIDTAGRYTTQDSDADVDQASWLGFLDLLKKYRKRRPINGIFVAMSVAELMTQTEVERRDHIRAIKSRVQELDSHFGIRFPVYMLFTKCDLVAGFAEFFDDLGRSDREQVWGATFGYSDDATASAVDQFDAEFDALLARLNDRLIDRINQEPDLRRRIQIHGFPKQIAMLKDHLGGLMKEVFSGSQYDSAPLLRGFYLISGTQEGTPIDRLLGSLASTFQLAPDAMPQQSGAGKSYFITDILRKVAFGEAEIAGTNRRVERQRAWLTNAAYIGIAAALVLAVVGWVFGYSRVQGDLEEGERLAREAASSLADVGATELDPLAVVPALNAARGIPGGYGDRMDDEYEWRFGLSQEDKIGDLASGSYRRLLEKMYLPRIMLRLEDQLRQGDASPDYVYEGLKAYLMLDSRDHYDPDAIRGFLQVDWIENLRRGVSTEQRASLVQHLEALLEERAVPLPLPLDDSLIAQARREVQGLPLSYRIYGRLKRTPVEGSGFDVRSAAGGAQADLVFYRKSGARLSEALPAIFTKKAYQQDFIDSSREITNQLADESWWILGEEQQISKLEQERLLNQVRDLYLEEFGTEYTNLLLDVSLAPFNTPSEAMRLLNILSQPDDSPLLLLLEGIAEQTELDQLGKDASITARVEDGAEKMAERLKDVLGRRSRVPDKLEEAVFNSVEAKFRRLNSLVKAKEGQPRAIDRLLGQVRKLSEYMSNVAAESAGGAIPPHVQAQGQAVIQQMKIESSNLPKMLVGEMMDTAAAGAVALTTGGLRNHLNQEWQSGPLTTCRQTITGRYPAAPASSQTIRLDDFGQFFGYGGVMDTFFNQRLRQYVDATRSPWRTRQTGNVPLQLSATALRAFENADVIKRTFFRQGSMQPAVSFDLRPLEMDTSLARFSLDLEGKNISYQFGKKDRTLMQWPGPNPGTEVRLEIQDRQSGQTAMKRLQGPWAWFQLLDQSVMQRTDVSEKFEVTFDVNGRTATYDLIARSAFNPFSLNQLRQFQCPERL